MMKNVFLLVIGVTVGLLLSEILLSLIWTNPYSKSGSQPYVELRQQKKGLDIVFDRTWLDPVNPRVNFRTDEEGYIYPSMQNKKADVTIAFLGGSTTECSYVQENVRFPALVANLLQRHSGLAVNTINTGVSGNTTHDALNLLINKLSEEKINIAVLMEATNDSGVLLHDHSYKSRMGQELTFFEILRWALLKTSRYINLVSLLRETFNHFNNRSGRRTIKDSVTSPYKPIREIGQKELNLYESRLRAFIGICQAFNITPVLMTQPLSDYKTVDTPYWSDTSTQRLMNDTMRTVAKVESVKIIDLAQIVLSELNGTNPAEYLYDGMHVTDKGSVLYANVIADHLQDLITYRFK